MPHPRGSCCVGSGLWWALECCRSQAAVAKTRATCQSFNGRISCIYKGVLRGITVLTKVFKSGNSLAIRIPKELAFIAVAQDVEIEKIGNALVIRPVDRPTLVDMGDILDLFSPEFMVEGREFHEEHERDWIRQDASAKAE